MEKEGLPKIFNSFFIRKIFLSCLLITLCQSTQLFAQTEVFKETFDTETSIERFTILDVNGDGEYWKYYTIEESARCATGIDPHDDWLIVPTIKVKAGYTYKLTCRIKGNNGSLEIGGANAPTDEALSSNILLPAKTYTRTAEQVEIEFTSSTTEDYYIGFHAIEGGFWSYVDVDDIIITETAPPQPETTLYGTIVTDNDNKYTAGIYSFVPNAEMELTPIAVRSDYISNGGGVFVDDKYYFTLFMSGDPIRIVYNIYDFNTESTTSKMYEGKSYIASDMAYDPTTNNVYCCSKNDKDKGYVFSTMDLNTGAKTVIAPIEMMVALAIDAKGKIYGISNDGILYSIDKTDASLTKIGDTGFNDLGDMIQSATIDPETGEFWWAMASATESGLYKVDTTNGKVQLIGRFPNDEHIAGLFVRKSFFNDKAPASVEDLNITFEGGSKTGKASFTVPTTDIKGNKLEDNVNFKLMVDNKEHASYDNAEPGTMIEIPINLTKEGWHEFVLIPYNSEGDNGKPSNKRMYVGYDIPKCVSDLTLKNDGDKMTITWTAPDSGINDGYIDTEALTYDIQRYPDYKWIATDYKGTSFTDVLESMDMKTYSYGIIAKYNGIKSDMLVSNFVTVGDELALPIMETFEIPQTFDTWTIVDANNDTYTWRYSNEVRAAIYEWSITEPTADDWLISPKFRLEAGKEYDLAIDAINSISGNPEKVEVAIGNDPTAEGMNRIIIPLTEIDNNTTWTTLKNTFNEATGGIYYIGIHVTSDTHIGDLLVRNISLKENPTSNISSLSNNEDGLEIRNNNGILTVTNKTSTTARIFSLDGRMCGMVEHNTTQQFNLNAGVYIVKTDTISKKVLVSK